MRAISFGKVSVAHSGVPVKFGRSFLAAGMTIADESLSVNSAVPFCQDMIPFKMDIDPTGHRETVIVKGISGVNFTVQRGEDGTTPVAHLANVAVVARFPIASVYLGVTASLSGSVFFGTDSMNISTGAGVILELNSSIGGQNVPQNVVPTDVAGNTLYTYAFSVDAAVDGEGPFVTFWQR